MWPYESWPALVVGFFMRGRIGGMAERDDEILPPNGTVLVIVSVLLMVIPITAALFGKTRAPLDHADDFDAGNILFGLFVSFVLGSLLLPAGITQLRRSPTRFSLRTLLIATTLVSMVLALMAYAATS